MLGLKLNFFNFNALGGGWVGRSDITEPDLRNGTSDFKTVFIFVFRMVDLPGGKSKSINFGVMNFYRFFKVQQWSDPQAKMN